MYNTGGAESVERAESIERTFEMPDKLGSNKKIWNIENTPLK